MRRQSHHPISHFPFIPKMAVIRSVTFYDVKPVNQLTHIVRISIFISKKEFFKFRICFTFKMRRIKAHFITILKQFQ